MARLLSLSLIQLTVVLATCGFVVAQSSEDATGRVIEINVQASALARNLLGTPDVQSAAVYLPPSYDRDPNRRYATIVLLHGIFDDYTVWLDTFDVPAILDRLILLGKIPELIVVMPNGGNKYGGGFYRNSPVSGRWGDYIADDLIAHLDENFRTLSNEKNRAIIGHSMGGYGALNLAMTRPGLFSVVWSMSPCCLAARDDFSFGNDAWKRAAKATMDDDLEVLLASRDFYSVAVLGVVTAFSPAPDAPPLYGDFPFDIVRGEVVLDDPAFDRYLDALPLRQVRRAREALRNLRGLALGVGLGDQFLHITSGTLEFSQQLGAERIPHLLDVYAGDHREHVAERLERMILPWVSERLDLSE